MDSYLDLQAALTLSESACWAGAAAHAFLPGQRLCILLDEKECKEKQYFFCNFQ